MARDGHAAGVDHRQRFPDFAGRSSRTISAARAVVAMAALLLLAYPVGAVIRFNIIHVENYLAEERFHDPVQWLARVTQGVLALAYAVSVAYYLKLLAEFSLKPLAIPPEWHLLATNGAVTAIIVAADGHRVRRRHQAGRASDPRHRIAQDRDHRRPPRRARGVVGIQPRPSGARCRRYGSNSPASRSCSAC